MARIIQVEKKASVELFHLFERAERNYLIPSAGVALVSGVAKWRDWSRLNQKRKEKKHPRKEKNGFF